MTLVSSVDCSSSARPKVQLDFWPEERRGVPNTFLRSAVFCAGKPANTRKSYREHTVAVLGPYSITYTGPQLYQPDLDVWLELMHRSRLHALGHVVEFQPSSVLRALQRATGKANYKTLISTFHVLRATAIGVSKKHEGTGKTKGYIGGLIHSLEHDDTTGLWQVQLDPRIASLFAPTEHTWLRINARLELKKSYLAKWLHGYFSSHEHALPISVSRLRELSGSQNAELRDFRRRLREALKEVETVEKGFGRPFDWSIDQGDCLSVAHHL